MRHVLFATMAAKGHLYPTLAIASELVARGYRVTYVTGKDLAEPIRLAGARPIGFATPLPETNVSDVATKENASTAPLLFFEEAVRIVRAADAQLGGDIPDLIVCDHSVAHAGRALSYRWDRPLAVFCPAFANNGDPRLTARLLRPVGGSLDTNHPAMLEYIAKAGVMMSENRMVGVSLEDFLIGQDGLTLVFFPREFQYFNEIFDDRYAFVGPCLGTRSFLGEWQPPADGRPVAVITRGTTVNAAMNAEAVKYFATCGRAFEGLDWHAVMSIGSSLSAADIGPLPPNVEVRNWLPYQDVLPRSRVFVNHAGLAGMMEAFYYGTPVVCLPGTADTLINGERAEELGLGAMIEAKDITSDKIRAAVLGVDGDEGIRQRVKAMRDLVRGAGGAVKAADVLLAYLDNGVPGRSWRHRPAPPRPSV